MIKIESNNGSGNIPAVSKRKMWTPKDVQELRQLVSERCPLRGIAGRLARTLAAVTHKMGKMGLSLTANESNGSFTVATRNVNGATVARRRPGRPRKTQPALFRLPTALDIYVRAREISFQNLITRHNASPVEEWNQAESELVGAFVLQYSQNGYGVNGH